MKKSLIILFCAIAFLCSCKKESINTNSSSSGNNSGNNSNPPTWISGKWVLYKMADTTGYASAYPSVQVETLASDTAYNSIGSPNYTTSTSAGTLVPDTLNFATSTTGINYQPSNYIQAFTYSIPNLKYMIAIPAGPTLVKSIIQLSPTTFKLVTPDSYGFHEIIVEYYQKL
jgi:hypothetical protein